MGIHIREVTKSFSGRNRQTDALDTVSFNVPTGQFVCLLGPSGCGKSTLLNIVAGLDEPTTGYVEMNGRPVTGPGRDRVMIFQEAALFPWLNVRDNVEFGLRMAGMAARERHKISEQFLALTKLTAFARAFVHELSGGMKQRVALARALALDPAVLLMDEPFAALDAQTRDLLHDELQDIWADTAKTILFVTHNVREAIVLGDRVLVFSPSPGHVKQEFTIDLPRPRHIDSHALVDLSHEILAVLKEETPVAESKNAFHQRTDREIARSVKLNFRQVGDDTL